MLRKLEIPGSSSGNSSSSNSSSGNNTSNSNNASIASAIVRLIFQNVSSCIQGDRSKVKLNMFQKGIIGGMVNDKVMNGINRYVESMSEKDLDNLLTDIDKELLKRRR